MNCLYEFDDILSSQVFKLGQFKRNFLGVSTKQGHPFFKFDLLVYWIQCLLYVAAVLGLGQNLPNSPSFD